MKTTHLFAAAFAASLSFSSAFAGGEGWSHDFEAAKKQAAAEKKDLLVDFTGSDWCGWCIKLNDEVFKHDEFKNGVKDKFVLVELDFPRDKEKAGVTEEIAKQNEALQEKFGIQGFPTILLLDASGKPFAKTGYQAGGAEKYVTHLDELRAHKGERDAALKKAGEAKGVEKAKALVSALKAMDLEDTAVSNFYGDVTAQIKEADPKDETGFTKGIEDKTKFADFQKELNTQAQKNDKFVSALAYVDETVKKGNFTGELQQQVVATKASLLAMSGKFDEAIKTVDEAKAIAPDSEVGKMMDTFKERLSAAKESAAKKPAAGEEEKEEEADK